MGEGAVEAGVFKAELTGGICRLFHIPCRGDIAGILLRLGAVYCDVERAILTVILPADIAGDNAGAVVVGIRAETVVPVGSAFRALPVFLRELRIHLVRRWCEYSHKLGAENVAVRAGILNDAVLAGIVGKLSEKLVYGKPVKLFRASPCVHFQRLHKAVPDVYFVFAVYESFFDTILDKRLYKIGYHNCFPPGSKSNKDV